MPIKGPILRIINIRELILSKIILISSSILLISELNSLINLTVCLSSKDFVGGYLNLWSSL